MTLKTVEIYDVHICDGKHKIEMTYLNVNCLSSFNGLKYHRERSNCELVMFGHTNEGKTPKLLPNWSLL